MAEQPVILIVDDEPHIRHILAESLEARPWQVLTAASATEALELCGEQTIDLVVLDKNLPDMSGVKLFWRLRSEGHPVACIMLTGYGSADSAVEMLNLGVSAYFEKPLQDLFSLGQSIDEILTERGARRRRMRRTRAAVEEAVKPPSRPVKPITRHRLTVLGACSVPSIREVLEAAFERETLCLVASRRALEVELLQSVDLVILDTSVVTTTMPALVREVRERSGEAAIVVLTQNPPLDQVKELIHLGVDLLIERRPVELAAFHRATAGLVHHLRYERS